MVDHPFRTAAAVEGGVYADTLLEAGVRRTPFVLAVDEELGDYSFPTGEIPLSVAWARTGFTYYYDSTDSTTPDDGLTTLVTGNGRRYAIEDAASISLNSVLDVVTAPTGSETVPTSYIVGVGTGAFAGKDGNLAILTRRGWVFAVPEIGMTVLNEATGQNTQFTDSGWGAFAVTFADGSIAPKALQFPGGIVVENTLNTPPGSPTTGKFWIVGSVPTGAFVGHVADLAYWTGSAWAFMDPADGWTVFHKTSGFLVSYISGTWLGGAGSEVQEFSTPGAFSWVKPAKGNIALIEGWDAGASGSKGSDSNAGPGGGGGRYWWRWVKLSLLAATETGVVGAGGAPRTTSNTAGQDGGASTFGTWLVGTGGKAGGGAGAAGGAGGATPDGVAATGGSPGGGVGGHGGLFGGGAGGGGTANTGAPGRNGGGAVKGGAGGGGGGRTVSGGLGGISIEGGNGGDGAVDSANAGAGAQPGGGGGGSENGNSGKGGDGRVRVTVF